jgi:hypothetical protein
LPLCHFATLPLLKKVASKKGKVASKKGKVASKKGKVASKKGKVMSKISLVVKESFICFWYGFLKKP